MKEQYYSCGFLFSPDLTKVVLIRKKRGPFKMVGKLNGIGGKFKNNNESSIDCQSREFLEETGIFIPAKDWLEISTYIGHDSDICHIVHFHTAISENYILVKSTTDEIVEVHNVADILSDIEFNKLLLINNLFILIPLALCKLTNKNLEEGLYKI